MKKLLEKIFKIILVPVVTLFVVIWILIKAISRLNFSMEDGKIKISFVKEKRFEINNFYSNKFILDRFINFKIYCSRYSDVEKLFNDYYYTDGYIKLENNEIHLNSKINSKYFKYVLGHEIGHSVFGKTSMRFSEVETFCDFYGALLYSIDENIPLVESISIAQSYLLEVSNMKLGDVIGKLNPYNEINFRFHKIMDLKWKMGDLSSLEIFNKINQMNNEEIREFVFK